MPSDPVEALAKVMYRAWSRQARKNGMHSSPIPWKYLCNYEQDEYRAMARAAIAHLSKTKRGAKRGK